MLIQHPPHHCHCAVCCEPFFSNHQPIEFQSLTDDRVTAQIVATEKMQGYRGVMQGGLISTLHDSAMTHCLFAKDIHAMTAELTVRYLSPVPLYQSLTVEATLIKQKRTIYYLDSSIFCGEQCLSTATAKFMCQGNNEYFKK
ncbi:MULTISPECIES: PaaI family thioesterase [Vibrio]|uniref:Acyl-coenzyme A thioesterase THEM4 n=1 Tax=Vibrio aestuarianus TaxID=28171 RepID=A0A9X4EWN1_9VIBR|nr:MULTISPECIES: PaaI family thioesterase [Vibrio]KOE82535.1 thioesterase [Vibrio alginolyticus]MDE1209040.1 PaaI family thioesterase [Vibrio aestuarianus]MDE1213009.1 PaaI family thioesterase [Vibrio aestuarianus]MDE1217007.1 PaaI family thioesterase [Vibrio aestuarianus]MDE1232832.1 PaaI family thioesterase [Vibrio aestuarianus]